MSEYDDMLATQAALSQFAPQSAPPAVVQQGGQDPYADLETPKKSAPKDQIDPYADLEPPPPSTPVPSNNEYDWMLRPDVHYSETARDIGRTMLNQFGLADRARSAYTAATSDQSYSDALKQNVADSEAARTRLGPAMSTIADVTGGFVPALGLPKVGLTLFREGMPIVQRLGAGLLEGAGYGAAQSAGHTYSDKPSDYVENAAMGGVIGGGVGLAAPVIAGGVSGAGRWIGNKFSSAPDAVVNAVRSDLPGIRNLPEGGILPDAGPSMQGLAQGVVQGTGEGRGQLYNVIDQRNAGSAGRITDTMGGILGPAPTPSKLADAVGEQMSTLGQKYDPLLKSANAINSDSAALHIEGLIGNERGPVVSDLKSIRGMLDIPGNPGTLDPNPQALQSTRGAVQGMIDNTSDTNSKRVLVGVRNMLTNELENKVPGIRELNSQYAELGTQQRALGDDSPGSNMFGTGKATVQRPDEFAATVAEAAQPKGVNVGPSGEPFRLQQAARAELERLVGTNKNDLATLNRVIGNPQDWNAQKLGIMFGPEKADAMMKLLANETKFKDTYTNVISGSQTAQRQAARQSVETGTGEIPSNVTLTGIGLNAIKSTANAVRNQASDATKNRIASWLATQDPAAQQESVNRILSIGATRDKRTEIARRLLEQGVIGGGAAGVSQFLNW